MRPKLKPLAEQVIVITGASSGNGLATAREAVRRGAAVVLAARNGEALARIERELTDTGGRAVSVAADVAIESDVARIVAVAEERFGGFDSWVNNAGVGLYGTLEQVPIADHRRTFDVNYFGTLHGCLAAAKHLRPRGGGAIVNVGSILGDRAIVQQGPYNATKHAIQGLTDTLRMELEREGAGISVTLIKPAGIDTPYPEHARNYMDEPPRIPQPLYDPVVVAEAILFACAHPRRTIYAGGAGLGMAAAGQAAPRITDWLMRLLGTRMQQSPGRPVDPEMRDNLYEPRADGQTVGTRGYVRRRSSLTVAAQKVPLSLWLGGAAALGLSFALRGSRSRAPAD